MKKGSVGIAPGSNSKEWTEVKDKKRKKEKKKNRRSK